MAAALPEAAHHVCPERLASLLSSHSHSLHLELELGVVAGTRGGVAGCALDVTTSDVRDECKKGLP